MTTLPQTTTVRLPRTTGQGAGGLPVVATHAPAPAGMTGGDVVRVLRSNLWLILAILALSIGAGFGLNYFLSAKYPRYTATALVEVVDNRPMINLRDPEEGNMDTNALNIEQKTQVALLKSDYLITSVLSKPDSKCRQTKWFAQFTGGTADLLAAAKLDFFDRYTVTALPDTKLVKIEFEWSDPQEAKSILEEVVDAHILHQQKVETESLEQRTTTLQAILAGFQQQKQQNDEDVNQLATSLDMDGGSGTLGRLGIKDIEMTNLVRLQTDAQLKFQDAQAMLDAVQSSLAQGVDPAPVQKLLNENQDLHMLRQELDKAQMEYQALAGFYGQNNPALKDKLGTVKSWQQKYDDAMTDAQTKARAEVVDELSRVASQAKEQLTSLTQQLNDLNKSMEDLTYKTEKYLTAMEKKRGLEEEIKEYSNRLQEINSETATSKDAKVAWNTRPDVPNVKSFPKLWMVMTVCVAIGLVLSLGIAFLREVTDQTVRSPRDIARVGQMNLLGMVPDEGDDPQAAGARLPLVIFDAPHSMTAEQLRQVRTRLQHAASLDTTRSIMVTSPSPGDGKTTIACNLAAGLALNGRRILLVDSNFRRPEIHRIFGLGNDHGFSDVLAGALAFDQSVQETSVPNLSVMTAGPKPINATEMFESQLLIDFIERCLEEYDHVVFDSGPIMIVAEASAMAPRVDGVVSVVRARGNSRGLLQRMRDDLRKVKAEHLGVVLNAVRAQGGGYYSRNIKTYYEYQNS